MHTKYFGRIYVKQKLLDEGVINQGILIKKKARILDKIFELKRQITTRKIYIILQNNQQKKMRVNNKGMENIHNPKIVQNENSNVENQEINCLMEEKDSTKSFSTKSKLAIRGVRTDSHYSNICFIASPDNKNKKEQAVGSKCKTCKVYSHKKLPIPQSSRKRNNITNELGRLC